MATDVDFHSIFYSLDDDGCGEKNPNAVCNKISNTRVNFEEKSIKVLKLMNQTVQKLLYKRVTFLSIECVGLHSTTIHMKRIGMLSTVGTHFLIGFLLFPLKEPLQRSYRSSLSSVISSSISYSVLSSSWPSSSSRNV